jgi:hypothetical protein
MSNYINSCKIFVSSVFQEELKRLRQRLKDRLEEAGHLPLLFEDNFGYWSNDTIRDCLQKVSESQILVLFIGEKEGSKVPGEPITVTYAEFAKALEENKIIIPFVKKPMLDFFKDRLNTLIKRKIDEFEQEFDREPDYTYDIVKEIIENERKNKSELAEKLDNLHVDDFNWAFIYDVYNHTNWTYSLELADSDKACKFINQAISQILKELSPYYSFKDQIIESVDKAEELTFFKFSAFKFLQCINKGKLQIKQLLILLSQYMRGGDIYHNDSSIARRVVAQLSDCSAITLYKRQHDYLQLIEYCGDITPEKNYMINDENSFVALTYQRNNDNTENIYYVEEKQQIYLTKKIGELVISAHFKLSEDWSETRVKSYEKQILNAILNKRDQFDFAVDLLGGMLNG